MYCKAIREFTSLQIASANNIHILLNIGVPDWRLDNLPVCYMQLLSQHESLITDGLTDIEITELTTLLPTLESLCQKLAKYEMKPSIVQPGFHDNNIVIDEKHRQLRLLIWERLWYPTFFSLTNCLYQAKRHHGLTGTDNAYQQLVEACLDQFRVFACKKTYLKLYDSYNTRTCVSSFSLSPTHARVQ